MNIRISGMIILAALSLTACADKPWLMESTKMEVRPLALAQERHIIRKPLAEMTDNDLTEAAAIYERRGAGPVYVVVAHPETGKGSTEKQAQRMAATLEGKGIAPEDIIVSAVPLTTDMPVALIAFDTLTAQAPEGCTDMPGLYTGTGKPADFDYKLSCGVKGYMAKQIARPKDLKGVAGVGGENDGGRAANIINGTLRTGAPREFLPSYIISSLAGGG